MSRAIGSFLIFIIAVQQIICQDDFQDFVRAKLEKLENENTRLNEENTKLVEKVDLYKKMSLELTSHLQSMNADFQNYKLKTTQLNHGLNSLQDVAASLTTAKSCWQLGMQGITRSGIDPFYIIVVKYITGSFFM